jgi:hypothetical protein
MGEQTEGHRQRLRRRFLAGEADSLTDAALLELLLTFAIPRVDVQPLVNRLLRQFGSLDAVFSADPNALKQMTGVGDTATLLLKVADKLVRRTAGLWDGSTGSIGHTASAGTMTDRPGDPGTSRQLMSVAPLPGTVAASSPPRPRKTSGRTVPESDEPALRAGVPALSAY